MDRRRSAALGVAAGFCALVLGAAAESEPPLRALRWLAPGTDVVRALGSRPAECLPPITDPERAWLVELGRTAFRTPLLVGGQAARAGLACDSCHVNGRDNPDFLFPGLSGAPGTADITSSLMSSHRGDGIDNSSRITDLGGSVEPFDVSRDPRNRELETFIRALVMEEFDGPEPPPAVVDGLAAYIRAQDPAVCRSARREPVSVQGAMAETRRAVRAAVLALDRRDEGAALLMIMAARSQLALIYERYDAGPLGDDRLLIEAFARDLAAAAEAVRQEDGAPAERLGQWLARSGGLEARLDRDQGRSLYDRRRLARLSAPARP